MLAVYAKAPNAQSCDTATRGPMKTTGKTLLRAGLFVVVAFAGLIAGARADESNKSSGLDYQLGSGLHIGNTGFTLGGYATASYDNLSGDASRFSLDNLSMFVWWEGPGRWKFFSEVEYENFADIHKESQGQDDYLSLERLYVDYALTATSTIRLGKSLTPVGRWNLIHATPLVWTTSRPLLTTLAFPTNMTGLMVTGTVPSIGNGLEYSIYGSWGDEFRPNPDVDPFYNVIGARVTLPLTPENQIGFSYANFSQSRARPERKRLVGLDYFWTHDRFEVSAEAVYRSSNRGGNWDEKGAFVQVVAPLTRKLYGVGRYEVFRRARELSATQVSVAGLDYRFSPAIILKAEWVTAQHNTINATTGFLSSISVLF